MTMSATARRGWLVAAAGLGLNLALGVLYSWSVIAKALTKDWGWSAGHASVPYATAVGMFALTMVFAGRAQDRFGPRLVATIGGALTGLGLIVASFGSSHQGLPIVLGFGVMTGMGIGLGYASATPAAVKWFASARTGMVTGIVVAGFGLASVYIAPLTTYLLGAGGVSGTFRTLGIAFFIATIGFSQLLVNPSDGYVPAPVRAKKAEQTGLPIPEVCDCTWRQMIKTRQFMLLWLMYACSAFAGLMIIGHMAKIAGVQLAGVDLGYVLVAVLAIGNAAGRIVSGTVSDRLGGVNTMRIVFLAQAVMMGVLAIARTPLVLIAAAAAVGFCYGSNLSVSPRRHAPTSARATSAWTTGSSSQLGGSAASSAR
jgi:OFA family oxalate/formate antiporter-like MFS transporter